ncbi:MAG TPA: CHASE4 domain-containing protein, partial [Candidatus Hydrogenedentes bacterium]|nr:CHASE4 domain-containing protein [Candidatus Hydrogenedentota bacterium]
MSRIQKKLVVFFGIIGFGTVAVLGVLLTWGLAQEYARMEEHFSNDCMRQVAGAFEQEFTGLKNNVTDWGRWDALYSFMSTRDPAFLRENIPEAVVGNLDLDLLVLADKGGEAVVVYTRQLAESGVRDLLVLLRSGGPLSVAAGDVNPKSG